MENEGSGDGQGKYIRTHITAVTPSPFHQIGNSKVPFWTFLHRKSHCDAPYSDLYKIKNR